MSKISKEIEQLLADGVIDKGTADKITSYYQNKEAQKSSGSGHIISILGALLVGAGFILLVAHNWDDLSRTLKIALGGLPLLIGYILCGYALVKDRVNKALNESAAVFTTMALGAFISIISQVYNHSGDATTFIFIWTALSIPMIYLLKSSLVSILSLTGMFVFITSSSIGFETEISKNFFWLLFAAVIPFYISLSRENTDSHSVKTHNWFVVITLTFGLWISLTTKSYWDISLLFSLLTILLLLSEVKIPYLGNHLFFTINKVALVTMVYMLATGSFNDIWLGTEALDGTLFMSKHFIIVMITTAIALNLLTVKVFFNKKKAGIFEWMFAPVFVVSLAAYFSTLIPVVTFNLLLLAASILTIQKGIKTHSFKHLNIGLVMISILIFSRFVDSNISFMLRGLIFIGVGAAFIFANTHLSKKLKQNNL